MDGKMTWNHRVVKQVDHTGEDWLEICEVYYLDDVPVGRTEGIEVSGADLEELRTTLKRMLACLEHPIMTDKDFEGNLI